MRPDFWKFKTYQRQFDEFKEEYLFGATDADLRECERNRTLVVGGYLFGFINCGAVALLCLSSLFWDPPEQIERCILLKDVFLTLFLGGLCAFLTAKVAFHLWEFFFHPAALYHFDKLRELADRLAGERERI